MRKGYWTTTSVPPPYDEPASHPSCRAPTPSAARTSRSPQLQPPSPCAGTRVAPESVGSTDAGDSSRVVERTGKDLREVDLLVGSGGVLRHLAPDVAHRILGALTGVSPQGWQQPEHPTVALDRDYVLAAVGLLAERRPAAAAALARSLSRCAETPES